MNSTDSTSGWYYLGPDVPAATPPEGGSVAESWSSFWSKMFLSKVNGRVKEDQPKSNWLLEISNWVFESNESRRNNLEMGVLQQNLGGWHPQCKRQIGWHLMKIYGIYRGALVDNQHLLHSIYLHSTTAISSDTIRIDRNCIGYVKYFAYIMLYLSYTIIKSHSIPDPFGKHLLSSISCNGESHPWEATLGVQF